MKRPWRLTMMMVMIRTLNWPPWGHYIFHIICSLTDWRWITGQCSHLIKAAEGMLVLTRSEDYHNFKFILTTLGQGVYEMTCIRISFFLTIYKLWNGDSNKKMSQQFGISEYQIHNILWVFTNYMYDVWKSADKWHGRDCVSYLGYYTVK